MNTSSEAVALSVSGLDKSYGDFSVIRGLDLEVHAKSVYGLVGLNGSGKTTTLECLLGLQGFNAGQVRLLNFAPADIYQSRGRVVGIFDTPSLNPNLTVRQCLKHASYLCETLARSPEEVEQLLGIERFSKFKIKNLSLGNKRRASIAQAILGAPELVILDEPFNGLDAGGVDDVLSLISTLNQEQGTTFLLSSHQLPYLERVCSHIAILHQGEIVANNEISQLLAHTSNSVLIKTNNEENLLHFLETAAGASFSHKDDSGYLHINIEDIDSAQLNLQLVSNEISVSELIQKRASLDSLFRELTSEANS